MLRAEIRQVLKSKTNLTTIICVGNFLRSDDGVGPHIAARLKPATNLQIIDAGYNPENCIDEAVKLKPDRIIIIDAADFGGCPGEVRIIREDHIPVVALSTHNISLKVICRILKEDTGAEIKFIGIQPKSVGLKEGLSPEVKIAADEIMAAITLD